MDVNEFLTREELNVILREQFPQKDQRVFRGQLQEHLVTMSLEDESLSVIPAESFAEQIKDLIGKLSRVRESLAPWVSHLDPVFCPYCASTNLKFCSSMGQFVEAGCWNGKEYCSEGDQSGYSCNDCRQTFMLENEEHGENCGCDENENCECGIYENGREETEAES